MIINDIGERKNRKKSLLVLLTLRNVEDIYIKKAKNIILN